MNRGVLRCCVLSAFDEICRASLHDLGIGDTVHDNRRVGDVF